MEYVSLITGFLIVLAGLWAIMTRRDLIRIIIGFSLFDTGTHVIIVALAYVKGRTAPIIDNSVPIDQAVNSIVDPIPQALVLTAIVIGLGVTALLLAYAMKMHKEKGTLEVGSFRDLKW